VRQVNPAHTKVACKNVWQVFCQRPSRLAPAASYQAALTDGGTGKNHNTLLISCKALRYILWLYRHHH